MALPIPPRARAVLTSTPFRLLVAVVLMVNSVWSTAHFARERFDGIPFDSAPRSPPAFRDVKHDVYPQNDRRLIVSRWDAEHYIGLALRGYSQCPHHVRPEDLQTPVCDAAFYPGYPALGWLVHTLTGLAIDYSLFAVSLAAGLLTLFLWTDAAIVNALGLWGAYVTLVLFNFYPTVVNLGFVMTDACACATILAGLVLLARERYALAALAVGASGAIRISGVAAEAAFALAVVAYCVVEPPRGPRVAVQWLARAALVPLGAWGSLVLSAYWWVRLGDPLLYLHGHRAAFHQKGDLSVLFNPQPAWIMHGIDNGLHDLAWLVPLLVLFFVGHREALRKLPPAAQVFSYSAGALTLVTSAIGCIEFYLQGMSRYMMVVPALFMGLGVVLKRRPIALAIWLIASIWHAREVDTCFYLGHIGEYGNRKCNMTQWIDF